MPLSPFLENMRAVKLGIKEPPPKKQPKPVAKVSEKRKEKMKEDKVTFELDKLMYKEIWAASAHICQCGCKKKLGKDPLTTFFHHLWPKQSHPEWRHSPENIMLLHPDCHSAYETNPLNRPEVDKRKKIAYKLLKP